MSCVIIFKKDIEKLGNKVLKKVYNILYDEDLLNLYEDIKIAKYYWNKNLVKIFKDFHKKDEVHFECLYFKKISYLDLDNLPHDKLLKKIEEQIKNDNIDLEIIFNILNKIKIHNEIDEDLVYNLKVFTSLYKVYYFYSSFL